MTEPRGPWISSPGLSPRARVGGGEKSGLQRSPLRFSPRGSSGRGRGARWCCPSAGLCRPLVALINHRTGQQPGSSEGSRSVGQGFRSTHSSPELWRLPTWPHAVGDGPHDDPTGTNVCPCRSSPHALPGPGGGAAELRGSLESLFWCLH